MPLVKNIDPESKRIITLVKATNLGYKKDVYAKYLASDYWRKIRNMMFHRAGKRCERCGDDNCVLFVHHRTYDRLGCEEESDLLLLCEDCHADTHNRTRNV